MRTIILASLVALAGGGCASPGQIRQNGYAHLERARVYETQGDYYRASKERAAADKQFNKAQARAYDEAALGIHRY